MAKAFDATYNVELESISEQIALLEQFPDISEKRIVPAMKRSVVHTQGNVRKFTPVFQGRLRSSIDWSVVESIGGAIQGIVDTDVEYAVPVEFGRKPGSFPPIEPLRRWAHLVLGDSKAAYAIARKIFFRGIPPRNMFLKGLAASVRFIGTQFEKARDLIIKDLVVR